MKYRVDFNPRAKRRLEKLDSAVCKRILDWIENELEGCENPRRRGDALHGSLKGKWRYRVGKYRIIAEIHDDEILILVIDIDKRNDIYTDI